MIAEINAGAILLLKTLFVILYLLRKDLFSLAHNDAAIPKIASSYLLYWISISGKEVALSLHIYTYIYTISSVIIICNTNHQCS